MAEAVPPLKRLLGTEKRTLTAVTGWPVSFFQETDWPVPFSSTKARPDASASGVMKPSFDGAGRHGADLGSPVDDAALRLHRREGVVAPAGGAEMAASPQQEGKSGGRRQGSREAFHKTLLC